MKNKKILTTRDKMLSILPEMSKSKDHYSIREIFMNYACYYMIWGERSNGKTYSVLEFALRCYVKFGFQLAVVRREVEDFKGKRGKTLFDNHIEHGLIADLTNGEWTGVYYYSQRWYLSKIDEHGKRVLDIEPFAWGFAISQQEHDKSSSYPKIKIVLFDEFLSRTNYLQDEFVLFTNTLSTIIRLKDDVVIFMLGNTVNKFCPYFSEMGITNARTMQQGTIDIYKYGNDEKLIVAVEYCGEVDPKKRKTKPSDKYWAFDNPKLNMIKTGAWEIGMYPHLPVRYKKDNILFTFFIKFKEFLLQCEIVQLNELAFIYIHEKTTPLRNDFDVVFSPDYNPSPYWYRRITTAVDEVTKKIVMFFKHEKVFYQNNEIGEVVRAYCQWSRTDKGVLA